MKEIERLRFAHLPTVVEDLGRLTERFGGPRLLIKRDDQTGLAFGGNKTRKLEFLLAEAMAEGAKMLVTAGAMQSNHCRQTAAAAARFGLRCRLVLAGEPPEKARANFLLDQLLGAEMVWTTWEQRVAALQETFEAAEKAGERPYLVPYGGSSPTGACGYVFAIDEMLEQGLNPDWIVFGSSSGGTQAGMVAGARLLGYQGKILGISIDEAEEDLKRKVADLGTRVADHLGEKTTFRPAEILVNADYCKAGYGVVTTTETQAIQVFAREEGILLDPVYTGRAAGGLLDLIQQGAFGNDETVLFWHTGGTPGLFAGTPL
jgi:D-cysteine desulfhydrase family pyridoxal phosphate-dependent enzyme